MGRQENFLFLDSKGRWIVSFGKYDGEFLDDVAETDRGYLEWFLTKDNVPSSVKAIVGACVDVD